MKMDKDANFFPVLVNLVSLPEEAFGAKIIGLPYENSVAIEIISPGMLRVVNWRGEGILLAYNKDAAHDNS